MQRGRAAPGWLMFVVAAIVPAAVIAIVTWRAVVTEGSALRSAADVDRSVASNHVRAEVELGRARAMSALRSLGSGSVDEITASLDRARPALADTIVVDVEGTVVSRASSAQPKGPTAECAAAEEQLATTNRAAALDLILAQCMDLRSRSGRYLWPLLAIEAGRTEQLAAWLTEYAARMPAEEHRLLSFRLRNRGLPTLTEWAPSLATAQQAFAIAETEPTAADRVEGGVRIHEGRALVMTRSLPNGVRAGYIVHTGSIGNVTASPSWPSSLAHVKVVPNDGLYLGNGAITPQLGFSVVERDHAWLDRLIARRQRRIGAAGAVAALLTIALATVLFLRAQRAARLAELRTDFVAAVSHELRTPLASVRLLAELLEAGDVPSAERPEVERTLATESRRLTSTLERMLRFGALSRGRLAADLEPVQIAHIVNAAAARFRANHPGRKLEVESVESEINADSGLLGLALDNLLSNAVKYAPDGGPYRLRAVIEDGAVVLAVSDRGPGLTPKERARIFLPFERADNRLSRATEGTGVGLALVRGIARAHGGDASVESKSGAGATFVIRFPIGTKVRGV